MIRILSLTPFALTVGLALVGAGCGKPPAMTTTTDPANVVTQHAVIVAANYTEALDKAKAMRTAIQSFVAAPSQTTLDAARVAWVAARVPYSQTEAFRFYGGPIDDPVNGPEGFINGWPLDENYIDYVEGSPMAGIINDAMTFATIDETTLRDLNEKGGEKNLATGYHAIEFLLWGQDRSTTGPGARPFTDYLTTGGTAANQARRAQYLTVVTDMLIKDLEAVSTQWGSGAGTYRTDTFTKGEAKEAIRKMLVGMGSLSGAELSGERMTVAYDTKEQEDEHSCFSDNTKADLLGNAIGIQNVYLGKYGSSDGVGIEDLVREKNVELDKKMREQLQASIDAINAIPGSFDEAIKGDDAAPGRVKVLAAINALKAQTTTIVDVAKALDITLNLE